MNFRYWRKGINPKRAGGKITDEEYMAKLAEEFGEVARAQSNRLFCAVRKNPEKRGLKSATRNLVEELQHVEFMAQCWREKIEAGIDKGDFLPS